MNYLENLIIELWMVFLSRFEGCIATGLEFTEWLGADYECFGGVWLMG